MSLLFEDVESDHRLPAGVDVPPAPDRPRLRAGRDGEDHDETLPLPDGSQPTGWSPPAGGQSGEGFDLEYNQPDSTTRYKNDNEIRDYRGGGRKQGRLYKPFADRKTKLYLEPRGQITTSVKVLLPRTNCKLNLSSCRASVPRRWR